MVSHSNADFDFLDINHDDSNFIISTIDNSGKIYVSKYNEIVNWTLDYEELDSVEIDRINYLVYSEKLMSKSFMMDKFYLNFCYFNSFTRYFEGTAFGSPNLEEYPIAPIKYFARKYNLHPIIIDNKVYSYSKESNSILEIEFVKL